MAVELTVIVKGTDGKTIEGASVSVAPGDVTGTTDSNGQVMLKIDGASRYDVTVSNNETSQTVPYYSLEGREAARLEVNLAYLQQREETKQTTVVPTETQAEIPAFVLPVAGAVIFAILLLVIVSFLTRKRREKKEKTKTHRTQKNE